MTVNPEACSAKHGKREIGRIPGVDDDRQIRPPGQIDVTDEHIRLKVVRPIVVIEVEARLPHGDYPGMRGQLLDGGHVRVAGVTGLLRMETHRGEDLRELFGQPHRPAGAGKIDARLDDEPDPGFAGVGDQTGGVGTAVIQMGVRIDEHGRRCPDSVDVSRRVGARRAGQSSMRGNSGGPPTTVRPSGSRPQRASSQGGPAACGGRGGRRRADTSRDRRR